MKIVKWNDVEIAQNPHGVDARKLYDTEHAQVVHIILEPGEKLKKTPNTSRCNLLCLRRKGNC